MSKKNRTAHLGHIDAGKTALSSATVAGILPPSFSPDLIRAAAKAAHEVNRRYCDSIGDTSQVAWDDAPDWQKDSAINGVQFAIDNDFPSGQAMHDNWMAEKLRAGWKYGPEKNPELLTHPCIVPYDDLPLAQRAKDDFFRDTVMSVLGIPGSIENPLPPDQLPVAGEAEGFATEAATEEEILDLDNPEDGDEPAKPAIYEPQWNLCLSLAFTGSGRDVLTNWGEVPECMAHFINTDREAPDHAVLIHVRRKLKVAVLVNEDQRSVCLAIQLFQTWLLGFNRIANESAEAAILAHRRALAAEAGAPRIDPEDQTFATEKGPFDEMSDLGKSLSQKAD